MPEVFDFNPDQEKEPSIIIKKSTEAPESVRQNPFYNKDIWGRANSPDDIYLPDSDQAISFAIAAHEIGHLVKADQGAEAGLDDFEATYQEEQRAWEKGWQYLKKYLPEYCQESPGAAAEIHEAYEKIRDLMMQATKLSQDMYLEKGSLDTLSPEEIQTITKQQREKFSTTEKGQEVEAIFEQIKNQKIGQKPNWDQLVEIVTQAVKEIIADNQKHEE